MEEQLVEARKKENTLSKKRKAVKDFRKETKTRAIRELFREERTSKEPVLKAAPKARAPPFIVLK